MSNEQQNFAAQRQSAAPPEAALLRRFREDLRNSSGAAETEATLANFWRTIGKDGTPICEEIAGDAETIVCTFVFKGGENTKSVFLSLPPFSRRTPEEFRLRPIAGSDVWTASVALPRASRFVYSLIVDSKFENVSPESAPEEIEIFKNAQQNDFFNRNRLSENRSYLETPPIAPLKYLEKRSPADTGKIADFQIKSEILHNERTISVYTPPDFNAAKTYPLLIIFDREIYLDEIKAPAILDNLRAENLSPPLIAVFVGNAPEKRADELTGNEKFAEFIAFELIEYLKTSYRISDNSAARIVAGASFGGLAAVFSGLTHPDIFGNILSQSGSFWRQSEDFAAEITARHQTKNTKQKIYLEAGIFETEARGRISLLEANRRLRDSLRDGGFTVNYREFRGGHGAVNWRAGFAEGLIFLTRNLLDKPQPAGNPNLF